jgi:hypothetical protein
MLQHKPFSCYYTPFCTHAVVSAVQQYCHLLKYTIASGQKVTYGVRRKMSLRYSPRERDWYFWCYMEFRLSSLNILIKLL